MDPSRPLLGRGALLSSSFHAAAGFLVVVLLLLTLLRFPLSISPHAVSTVSDQKLSQRICDPTSPLDCADPQLFHLMMRSAIDTFHAVHFSRFGRPVPGDPPSASCDMAWRARSDSDSPSKATTKDYRRFAIARHPVTCAYSVLSIGDYHSGPNARKPRRVATNATIAPPPPPALSRSQFAQGAYLAYLGGGDRCKPMPHYLRSLLCALTEARYLNRTLVLDLTLCLAASYAAPGTGGMPEEGKRLAFYVDVDHLHSQFAIIEGTKFWADWDKWGVQGQLGARLIEDTRLAPIKFSKARDTLIVRKFGDVEPGNYWYNVCEGEAKRVLRPLRPAIRWAPSLMHIVNNIISRMQADFDSVHTGGNVDDLSQRIQEGVDGGRQVYVAGIGVNSALVEALKAKYRVHYLDEFEDLWGTDSKWFLEMRRLNGGVPVEFDGYMREVVDREVFLKGKKKVEVLQ
ncbi:uncharacterized protein LOC133902509 [Phragmites australis]|uniref:uncharacterized protein LOC133902509 n=1 Tax=Phragmites australis TaxID=29695 RepID=UPI002D78E92E|nr:uncharacterized protein LOC133902509 [Phragmites australis]